MKSIDYKELRIFLLFGGLGTIILLILFIWLLRVECNSMKVFCLFSLFLIQAPAAFIKTLFENIFNLTFTTNQIKLTFFIITVVFWFLIGVLIGYVSFVFKSILRK